MNPAAPTFPARLLMTCLLALAACTSHTPTCPAEPGVKACGSACVFTNQDPLNCGGCGHACSSAEACVNGSCQACGTSETLCTPTGGFPVCTDTQLDIKNCGHCGNACPSGQACVSGMCLAINATGKCSTNADCASSQDGAICDPISRSCVECLTSADCANSPYGSLCDTSWGGCVECLAPSDCPYDNPGCNQGYCGYCASNTDCPANNTCSDNGFCLCNDKSGCGGDAPVCLTDTRACGCSSNSQCSNGEVCDTYNFQFGACQPPCTDASCASSPGTPFCDPNKGVCVPCRTNADCANSTQGSFCTSTGCAQCGADADCQAKDASTPYCIGLCVQCRTWEDCPAENPGCNFTTGACGSCTQNSDCAPGKGCLSGMCAAICTTAGDTGCAPCTADTDCAAHQTCKVDVGLCQ